MWGTFCLKMRSLLHQYWSTKIPLEAHFFYHHQASQKNPWKDWMSSKTDYYTSLITATARLPYPFGVCNLSILLLTFEETLFCNILTSDFVDFLLQVKFSFEILPWLIKVNHWKTSLAKTDIRKPSTFPLSKLPIMGVFEPLFFYWLQKEG